MPAIMRVDADGASAPGAGPDRHDPSAAADRGSPGSASRCCRRTAGRSPWSPTARIPTESDVVLQFYDLDDQEADGPGRRRRSAPLGHQDPAWRADGKFLLYVRNGRDAATRRAGDLSAGTSPTRRPTPLTGPGYLEPSYSPDGTYIAATRTSSFGNDVVILDAANGRELLRVTDRRRIVGAGLVAGRRRDRLPPHRRPDRRPQAGQARRAGAGLDGDATRST